MLEQEHQYQTILIDTFKNVATHKMKLLSRLKLATVYDLLFNLPFRFEDHTYIQPLSDLQVTGPRDTPCTVLFTIVSDFPDITTKATKFTAQDISGEEFILTFFNCPEFMINRLLDNDWFLAYGHVTLNHYSQKLTMLHPELVQLSDLEFDLPTTLSPIYHLTKGVRQDFLRRLETRALSMLTQHPLDELIPAELNPFKLTINEALLLTHNPPPTLEHANLVLEELPSFQRICFEELVAYKIAISTLREHQETKRSILIPYNREIHQRFLASLPFSPTQAQLRSLFEVMGDCVKDKSMSRILNGDVGSGKTLVATMCMLQCAAAGLQAVMMAPTEILAQQHYAKLKQLFEPLGISIGLLTGATKKKERQTLLKQCASGELKLLVGTHALFQKAVKYQCLALVIIDEQHRFGVNEREALLNKAPEGFAAHELLMTATPIPRSLRLALFKDTQVSILNEMPKGRLPIVTSVVEFARYPHLVERLRLQCEAGEQAFWICPFVEEMENSNVISVKKRIADLQRQMPHLKIGLLHGKMSEKEKNEVMTEFLANHYQILVATVIVEVGVDVPNASIIVIEEPQRLGLSQLHQLRGRVGRGSKQSFCILLYRKEETMSDKASKIKTEALDTRRTIGLDLATTGASAPSQGQIPGTGSSDFDGSFELFPEQRVTSAQGTPGYGSPREPGAQGGPGNLGPGYPGYTGSSGFDWNANQGPMQDMMDWNSDSELNLKLKEILRATDSVAMKRLNILKATNNGFAIASQDLILRGPGEFFGQNQTGNENFRFADMIRDSRMLSTVNSVAALIYHNDKQLSQALIARWYPALTEDSQLVQAKNPDTSALSEQIKQMTSDDVDEDEPFEPFFNPHWPSSVGTTSIRPTD